MTFSDTMDELEATRKEHFATLFRLIAQLRNEKITIDQYQAQVRALDDQYHSSMRQLMQKATEESPWMGIGRS
jgi:hypothetical protein